MTLFVFGEFGGWVEWDTKKIVTIILCLLLLSVLCYLTFTLLRTYHRTMHRTHIFKNLKILTKHAAATFVC